MKNETHQFKQRDLLLVPEQFITKAYWLTVPDKVIKHVKNCLALLYVCNSRSIVLGNTKKSYVSVLTFSI